MSRDFRLVWLGQVLSQGGTRCYQIALLWWLLGELPASSRGLAAGAFLVVGALPSVVLVGQIGRLISRVPSRTVMLRAELIAFVFVAVLAIAAYRDAVPVWSVYVVGLVLATCQAFFDPTLMKSLPELVPAPEIQRAVGYGTSTQSVANFAGAAFGALLLASVGFPGAVLINALSYGVSVVCISLARFRELPAAPPPERGTWAFLGTLPGIRPLLLCFAFVNFFSAPTLLVLPLYTKSVLGLGPAVLASLEAALWLGLLVGAFVAPRVKVSGSVTRFGAVCVALFGVFLAVPGVAVSALVYVGTLFVSGFFLGVCNVKFTSLFQEVVPNSAKGRFFAALMASVSLTFPVAFLTFGAFGDLVNAQTLCLLQGFGLLALSFVLSRLREPARLSATVAG
ncbi:MFS transporter [Lentzea sp. NBRC 105346]|uniref:MFS transporter n=1 Tax=Lentzea sp. NBRC 105346 TaxID=3032205 RepID=UPI0024A11641|nr:MFS transporter [Lentzea sp. NBRC 105346]GLZ30014.1 MFS transporter [Lentzea sp. NBRC 105346]